MNIIDPYNLLSLYKEAKQTKILTNKACLLNTYTYFFFLQVVQLAIVKYLKQELVFKD